MYRERAMEDRQVYFDHNATTPMHPEVIKTLSEAMAVFGNPSSLHGFGRQARDYVEEARGKVASFIGASADEVLFVGSGSEGNNTVLSILTCASGHCSSGYCCGSRRQAKDVITTAIEHPCILETAKCLATRGAKVAFLGVDEYGKIHMDQLQEMLDEGTGMVSVMMANNELGTIQDIKSISEITHKAGALFHTDAVQAVGKLPTNVDDLGVDFLTMSAHKIYGPKGVGALYVRGNTPFCPLIRGGHQERGRRAGTENSLGIIGLGKAVELRAQEMEEEHKRLAKYRAALKQGLEDTIPDIFFNGHPVDCLPSTLNVSFEGAEGEAILLYLDLEGIAVSTGSACASGSLDPSHVLMATGMPVERAHGSIRISMGRSTTQEDVDYFLDRIPKVIGKIREMSTAYAGK